MHKFLPLIALFISVSAYSQSVPKSSDFKEDCDSLKLRLEKYIGAESEIRLKKVMLRGNLMDFYFRDELSFYPWRAESVLWFREKLDSILKERNPSLSLGKVFSKGAELSEWSLPWLNSDGTPVDNCWRMSDPRLHSINRFIQREKAPRYMIGLSDRYIALWQSHGRYYKEKDSLWHWQRAMLHRTVEDMFTQSYVLPLLIPMLENAGAYVMTPRERDVQTSEIICDGDRHFASSGLKEVRQHGRYEESGSWSTENCGFADLKQYYELTDNPFTSGSCRKSQCRKEPDSEARWTARIQKSGRYAVYVSYKSLPQSSSAALYTVRHLGGETEFKVNQKRAGGTWVYLGTFNFMEEGDASVTLSNKGEEGEIVTADAVRFGGGYGKVKRDGISSGLPAYMEGSLYSMPWYGIDSSVYMEKDNDYTRDFFSRGIWVNWMKKAKGVPFDASLAFHTDAGLRQNDSIVGTLAIHCLYSDGKREYVTGGDRMSGRLMADMIQTQVTQDIRRQFEPEWNRRGIWNKMYAECRTPEVPSMILELLSHQNLADMKYGEDPAFKFTVCRAVYKGLLKFISSLYGCAYEVQPLPVNSVSALFDGDMAVLQWKPTADSLEPTAVAKRYIVYTRIDDGEFDEGIRTEDTSYKRNIKPGHIYSFRIVACNDGGSSFPSETVSIGRPEGAEGLPVLIVNNFNRVCSPAWIDSPRYAGFMSRTDSGVPYINDISYIGENYDFDKESKWISDSEPGFGATHPDNVGLLVAGNIFNYPFIHGRSLMKLGVAFCSMSAEAFTSGVENASAYRALDLICGKQSMTRMGSGRLPDRYPVYSKALKSALVSWTSAGGNVIVSGSSIASDRSNADGFSSRVFGFSMESSNATGSSRIGNYPFHSHPNSECYCIEAPDGLSPAGSRTKIVLRYEDTGIPAAVHYSASGYKVFASGVPFECIVSPDERLEIFKKALKGM